MYSSRSVPSITCTSIRVFMFFGLAGLGAATALAFPFRRVFLRLLLSYALTPRQWSRTCAMDHQFQPHPVNTFETDWPFDFWLDWLMNLDSRTTNNLARNLYYHYILPRSFSHVFECLVLAHLCMLCYFQTLNCISSAIWCVKSVINLHLVFANHCEISTF